jgi:hypothetical protein
MLRETKGAFQVVNEGTHLFRGKLALRGANAILLWTDKPRRGQAEINHFAKKLGFMMF